MKDTLSTYESVPVLPWFSAQCVCTKADKHRPSKEAGWVRRNVWLEVTGKLFKILKNSFCRSFPSKKGQCWQSIDAFFPSDTHRSMAGERFLCAGGVSELSVLGKDAQWHSLVSL